MGCGPGIGGFLMDDLIYPRLWQASRNCNNDSKSTPTDNSDIRRLFPDSKKRNNSTRKSSKKSSKKSQVPPIVKKKGTPEWLAMSIGIFFVGALFSVASYRIYTGSIASELDHVNIYSNERSDESVVLQTPPVYNGSKLPANVLPTAYILYLYPQIEKKKYTGLIKISIVCQQITSEIVLHSSIHKIRKVDIKSNSKTLKIKSHVRNKFNEMLILTLNQKLQVGATYHVLIGFGNTLGYNYDHGIYLSTFRDGNGKAHEMVSTDFEPIRARRTFPCFDEPAMKATYTIILQHKAKGYHAISNMPIVKNVSLPGGNVESFFETTPKMSSYLAVVAVTEYGYKETKSRKGVKIRCYGPDGRLNETTMALKFASLAVDYYSKNLGIAYNLPRLGMMPVSRFSAAADETWGMILASESSLLYNVKTSTQSSLVWIAKVVSHEISHQWFGDLVTMKWWNDLWLKESFAAYLEYLPLEHSFPSWGLQISFYSKTVDRALSFDSSTYTHAIEQNAGSLKVLLHSYDSITYDKGAAIVNMLGKHVGNTKFFKGIKIYMEAYKYKNANITQLWESLSKGAKPFDVRTFMDTWITKPGFPLVTMKRVGKEFVFTQAKFVYKSNLSATVKSDSTVWHVPIPIKTCGKISKHLLKRKSGKVNVTANCGVNEMYKANYGSSGFYRVNYDTANWARLLKQMNTKHTFFPAIDRASMLSDLYSLVRFNYVDITIALDFTKYLDKEHNPAPFRKAINILSTIRFVFVHTKLNPCVKKYMSKKVRSVMVYLNKLKKRTHVQKNMISLMISYGVGLKMQPLTDTMENKFLKWILSKGTMKLPTNLRYPILYAGIVKGKENQWNFVYKQWKKAKSMSDKNLYLSVLSSTNNKRLLTKLVNEAANGTKLQADILQAVCNNWVGRPKAWASVKQNWEALYKKYQSSTSQLKFLLNACLINGRTAKNLSVVKSFMTNATLGATKITVERIIERIQQNIDFKQQQSKVTAWFKKVDPDCLK